MPRMKLVLALAAGVLFAQLQCVAACTADLCDPDLGQTQPVPPCHKHHDESHDHAPSSCSFHLIVAQATSPDASQLDIPVLSMLGAVTTVSPILPIAGDSWMTTFSDPSPPGITALLSSTVLRV